MEQGYTHINEVIEKIKREGFEDVHATDVKEYVWDIISFIATPNLFPQKTAEVEVDQYRAQLPIDFYSLAEGGIRDKESKIVFKHSTDLFHKLNRQQDQKGEIIQTYSSVYHEWDEDKEKHVHNPDEATYLIGRTGKKFNPEDFTFTIEQDVIFIPFEHRTLEVSYKAFPVFDDYTPKIPNDAKTIRVIVSFIIMKLAKKMLLQGTLGERAYDRLEQEYMFDVASARSANLMNTPNQMENIKNRLLDLVPKTTTYRQGHRFKNQDSI